MEQEQGKKKSGGAVRRLFIAAALAVVAAVLLALAGGFWLLRTDSGRARIESFVERAVSSGEIKLTIDGLAGRLPGQIICGRLALSDAEGVFLEVRDLEVDFWLRPLLKKIWYFKKIAAGSVELSRLPGSSGLIDGDDGKGFKAPKAPRVVVEELDLERVAVDEQAFGRAALLRIVSQLHSSGREYTVRATAERLDRSGDVLQVSADAPGDLSGFSLNATLAESPGGLVGGILGLPVDAGLEADLSGDGKLNDWSGVLNAAAPGTGRIHADFSVAGGKARTLKTRGRISSESYEEEDALWRLAGREADFDLEVTRLANGGLELPLAEITGEGVELRVSESSLAPGSGKVAGLVHARVKNHAALADLACMDALEVETLDIELSGDLDDLGVSLEAKVTAAEVGGVRAENSALTAKGVVSRLFSGGLPGFSAAGRLDSVRIALPYNRAELVQSRIAFDASSKDIKELDVPRLEVTARGVDVRTTGGMSLDASRLDANVQAEFMDAGRLLPEYAGLAARGLSLTAKVGGSPRDVRFEAEGRGRVRGLRGLPEAAEDLAGADVDFKGRAGIEDGKVSTPRLDLAGAGADLALSGQVIPDHESFTADWTLKVRDPEWALRHLGLGLEGKPTVRGSAFGTFRDFKVDIKAFTDGVLFSDEIFKDFTATAEAPGLPENRSARFDLGAAWRGRPLGLSGRAELGDGRVEISGLEFTAPKLKLAALASVQTGSGLVTGSFSGRTDELSEYSDLLGPARGSLDFSGKLAVENGEQVLYAKAKLFEAKLYGAKSSEKGQALFRAGSADVQARLQGLWSKVSGTAELDLNEAVAGPVEIDAAHVNVSGDPGSMDLAFRASGSGEKPFSLQGRAGLELSGGRTIITLPELAGLYAGTEFRSARPARIEIDPDGYSAGGLDFTVGKGRVLASGRLEHGQALADVRINGLDLALPASFYDLAVSGELDAQLTASGTPQAPDVKLSAVLSELRPGGNIEILPVRAVIEAAVRQGLLSLDASVATDGEQQFSLTASTPLELSVSPWRLETPAAGGLQGRAHGVLNLGAAMAILDLEDQYVSGRAPLEATISGSVSDPRLNGSITLDGVRYEHLRLGAVLEDITGRIDLDGDKIHLRQIVGSDGRGGKLYVNGDAFLDSRKGLTYDLILEPRHAQIIQTDRIRATIQGGLKLAGDLDGGGLSGKMDIDPAEVRLPESTPPEVVEIDVTKVNAPPGEDEGRPVEGPGYALDLDVGVEIPARFRVQGRGLEAEFKGQLVITGTTADPDVRGQMEVIRGHYDFLDQRLALEQGSLVFTGKGTTPLMDVVAAGQGGGATAKVRLAGPADDFSLELTSDPPLPENEIMARLLFGRRSEDLNPIQAVQLANALARLTGAGGTRDVLGEARRSLGLDQLQVSGGEQGAAPALGVGKYLRENVYLEVERDFTTGGQDVSVEVELTPSVGVSGKASQYAGSEVGAHWKINY